MPFISKDNRDSAFFFAINALDEDMNANEEEDLFESRLAQIRKELAQSTNKLSKTVKKQGKRNQEDILEIRKHITTTDIKIDQVL